MTPDLSAFPLVLIAAVAKNRVIGGNNRLLWKLPEDMRHFKATTTGHSVLMGRKTWDSLPKALPNRQNIAVTHSADAVALDAIARKGGIAAHSLDEALAAATLPLPVFCIGGAELYRLAMPRARALLLTEIDRDFDGDAFFPEFDAQTWHRAEREDHPDGSLPFSFNLYVRR
jgi:dihydrofolate reductase